MIKKIVIIISLGIVLIFFNITFRCKKINHLPAAYVAGIVTDSLTGLGIDSAWVDIDTIPPHDAYTDSLGNYIVFDGGVGRGKFRYGGKNGYITKRSREYETLTYDTTIVNFQLVPTP